MGSVRANLLLYDKRTLKLENIRGNHSHAIFNGCWNLSNNYFAVCDKQTVTVNDALTGDTIV